MSAADRHVRRIWELRADAVCGIPVGGCGSPKYLQAVRYLLGKYGHLMDLSTVKLGHEYAAMFRAEEMPVFTPVYILFPETTWCIGRVAYVPSVNREQLLGYAVELLSTARREGIKYRVGSYWHQLVVQADHFLRCVTVDLSRHPNHPMYPFLKEWQPVLERDRGSVDEVLSWGEAFLGRSAGTGDLSVVPQY